MLVNATKYVTLVMQGDCVLFSNRAPLNIAPRVHKTFYTSVLDRVLLPSMTPQKIKYLDIVYLYMFVLRNAITTAALSLKPFNMQPYRLKIAHPIYLKY